MSAVLLVIHLLIAVALIVTVLLQRSEGGALGIGGGGAGALFSSRGTANVLTRTTAILAAVFFSTSLILSILAGVERKPTSILGGAGTPATGQQQPGGSGPAAPGGSLLDQFQGQPAQPSAPQAPRSQ